MGATALNEASAAAGATEPPSESAPDTAVKVDTAGGATVELSNEIAEATDVYVVVAALGATSLPNPGASAVAVQTAAAGRIPRINVGATELLVKIPTGDVMICDCPRIGATDDAVKTPGGDVMNMLTVT